MTTRVIRTKGFDTSTGGHASNDVVRVDPAGRRVDDELAYIYCTDESGYCLSVARFPDDELVEVMVIDQVHTQTREVVVELTREQLRLHLSLVAVAQLDGTTDYVIPLAATEDELQELDAALSVLFEGGQRGQYTRRL